MTTPETLQPRRVLVTGAAGFIGFHVCQRLLADGTDVLGVDSLTPYYDPRLKHDRLAVLQAQAGFRFGRLDLADRAATAALFQRERFDAVLHLAAQAGVRYSVENPLAYLDSNLAGMMNVLEGCRRAGVAHLVYASSSSVYGAGNPMPLTEDQVTDRPVSLYAASKKANEVMVHSYSHLYGLPASGLRLFTVYGPWAGPTWRSSASCAPSRRARPSTSTTTARCGATSPMSATWSRPSCACCAARHCARAMRRRSVCSTWATVRP